jgi:hypothetical protein
MLQAGTTKSVAFIVQLLYGRNRMLDQIYYTTLAQLRILDQTKTGYQNHNYLQLVQNTNRAQSSSFKLRGCIPTQGSWSALYLFKSRIEGESAHIQACICLYM